MTLLYTDKMTRFKEIIFIFSMSLVLGLSSCIYQDDLCQEEYDKNELPTMSIFLGLDTRTPLPGEDFEDGVGYENFIDINNDNYRIYFFDSESNTFIDSFESIIHPSFNPENPAPDGSLIFNGYLFPELGSKFKIVVLANWQNYPDLVKGETTIAQLTTHVGSQFDALTTPDNGAPWLGKDRLMPFYGVRSFDLSQTHASCLKDGEVISGSRIDLTAYPIPLLRSMAKVEVELDDSHVYFDAVELPRINNKGFSAPFQYRDDWKFDSSDYYSPSGGWPSNYARGVHLVNDVNDEDASQLQFTKVTDRVVNADGSVTLEKWVAYMPEYRNKNEQKPASIRVKLNPSWLGDSSDESSTQTNRWREFFFTPDGEAPTEGSYAPDIERNNIYRFKIDVDGATLDVQPYTEHNVRFEFGLVRDDRGDLMVLKIPKRDENGNVVLDEKGDTVMTYPQYFLNFIADDNPNHKYPVEMDDDGKVIDGGTTIRLEDGDYYAIVVGEDGNMSNAEVWVKDRAGCRVLSNISSTTDTECSARLVQQFYGNNQSEIFHKDIFGYRRIYHFDNHNTIVLHPVQNNMLFRVVHNFGQEGHTEKYYEVESWDDSTHTGWIINKDADGKEVGFQKITSDGVLGEAVDLNGSHISN